MGILKSAADLVYTIRFLKLLVTPFEDTPAYKAGIIDKEGKKRKDFNTDKMDDRENYRDHYTAFHRLVYNLKKIMAKAPGGQSVIARYGAGSCTHQRTRRTVRQTGREDSRRDGHRRGGFSVGVSV